MVRIGKNDHAAIQTILAGDKEAYGALVKLHSSSLLRVVFRITGNEAGGRLTQNQFFQQVSGRPRFSREEPRSIEICVPLCRRCNR
jgi:DNA-directed RNA polymerase specialized sigma24 family protein